MAVSAAIFYNHIRQVRIVRSGLYFLKCFIWFNYTTFPKPIIWIIDAEQLDLLYFSISFKFVVPIVLYSSRVSWEALCLLSIY